MELFIYLLHICVVSGCSVDDLSITVV